MNNSSNNYSNNNSNSENNNNGKQVGRITINHVSTSNKGPQVPVKLAHAALNMDLGKLMAVADTGAEVCVAGASIIPKHLLNRKHLLPPTSSLFTFNGQSSPCIGILPARLSNKYYETEADIYICPAAKGSLLLSLEASKSLGYIPQEFPNLKPPLSVSQVKQQQEKHRKSHARDPPPLQVGQHVHVQDSRTKLWDKVGQVLEVTKDHSYKVKVDSGGICWRIRKFIYPVPEPPDSTSKSVTPDVGSPSPASSKGRGEKRVRFNPPPDPPHHSSRPTRRPAFYGSWTAPPLHQVQGGDDASAIVQRVGPL